MVPYDPQREQVEHLFTKSGTSSDSLGHPVAKTKGEKKSKNMVFYQNGGQALASLIFTIILIITITSIIIINVRILLSLHQFAKSEKAFV